MWHRASQLIIEATTAKYLPHTEHNSSCNTITVEISDQRYGVPRLIALSIPVMEGRTTMEVYSGPNYIRDVHGLIFHPQRRSYSKLYDLSIEEVPTKYLFTKQWLTKQHEDHNWPGPIFERSR